MPEIIRVEKIQENCPKCKRPLEPTSWNWSPADYIKRSYCDICDVIFEYELPRGRSGMV